VAAGASTEDVIVGQSEEVEKNRSPETRARETIDDLLNARVAKKTIEDVRRASERALKDAVVGGMSGNR
jgi:hypothetical protein